MPLLIDGFVRHLVQLISVAGMPSIWETVTQAVMDAQGVLRSNNIVAAYRDFDGSIKANEIGYHSVDRPFGVLLTQCGGVNCQQRGKRAHIIGRTRIHPDGKPRARIACVACQWESQWVSESMLKDYIHVLHREATSVYYHEFPIHPAITSQFSISARPQQVVTQPTGGDADIIMDSA